MAGRFKAKLILDNIPFFNSALLLIDPFLPQKPKIKNSDRMISLVQKIKKASSKRGIKTIYVLSSAPRIGLEKSELAKHFRHTWDIPLTKYYQLPIGDPQEYHFNKNRYFSIPEPLQPQADDFCIRKHAPSGFFDTRLDVLLQNLKIKYLFCISLSSDLSLLATTLDGCSLNYRVIALREATCCFSYLKTIPQKTLLTTLESTVGYTVNMKDFLNALS